MVTDKSPDILTAELVHQRANTTLLYRLNTFAVVCLTLVSILASAAASLSVAGQLLTTPATAIIAAVPALCLTLLSAFQFQERANWHRDEAVEYGDLLQRLKFANEDTATVSLSYVQFQREHAKIYPGLGKPPGPS